MLFHCIILILLQLSSHLAWFLLLLIIKLLILKLLVRFLGRRMHNTTQHITLT